MLSHLRANCSYVKKHKLMIKKALSKLFGISALKVRCEVQRKLRSKSKKLLMMMEHNFMSKIAPSKKARFF